MTESRLDPSDAQVSRHAMGQLAEQASIMRMALIEQGFVGAQLDGLLIEWWKANITAALQPDLIGDMKKLMDQIQRTNEED